MANPYSVLGVQKNADKKAIKSAFRKLAKNYHPDQNADNKNAKTKFAEINQAYQILGDKEKRAQFDRGEIDEKGQPRFAGFAGGGDPRGGFRQQTGGVGGDPFAQSGFGGAEDILGEIFGSALGGQRRNADFGDPFAGTRQQYSTQSRPVSLDVELKATVTIEDLMRGKASIRLPDGKRISVSVPPEAENNKVIRLKGKGKNMAGRRPGDALVTLVIKPHPEFVRSGTDLRLTCLVPLRTAVLGGKAAVATVGGKISLNIPAGTNSGKVFRLKGKGLPKKAGGYGDLLVETSIQLPEERMDDLRKLFDTQVE